MDPLLIVVILFVLVIGAYIWYKTVQNKREREYQEKLQQLPESERQVYVAQKEGNKNWGCLTAFLVLAVIANSILAIVEFSAASSANGSLVAFGGLLNVLCAVFAGVVLWKRKRWAVYGYITSIVIIILINLGVAGFGAAAPGVLPLLFLFTAVRPVWNQLE